MRAWLESIAGPEYASALMWTVFALIGLLVLLILIRIVRGLTFGTFVAGGRNRKARLAVMDATAVDSHRRLVLVRRDDVEHLILIGGPTDVVVEQNIRLLAAPKRVSAEEAAEVPSQEAAARAPLPQAPAPQPVRRPAPPAMSPSMPRPPQTGTPAAPPPQAVVQPPAPPVPRPATDTRYATMPPVQVPPTQVPPPQAPQASVHPAPPVVDAASRAPAPSPSPQPMKDSLDDALLRELESSLEGERKAPAPPQAKSSERSLDDEMNRLLDNLSAKR